MSEDALRTLARAAGIAADWTDAFGQPQQVGPESLRAILQALQLPAGNPAQCTASLDALDAHHQAQSLPAMLTCWSGDAVVLRTDGMAPGMRYRVVLESGEELQGELVQGTRGSVQTAPLDTIGYHQIELGNQQVALAVAPRRCFGVDDAIREFSRGRSGGRAWGLAAQLYSLRREGGGGLGDFTALQQLATAAGTAGAAALAISPVHAMFSADPGRFSPYGPSSRVFLNALHVDPAQALGADALQEAARGLPSCSEVLARLEAAALVDWPAAAALRLQLLRRLFDMFRGGAGDQAGFAALCKQGGTALEDHARYEAIDAWLRQQAGQQVQGDWRQWPEALRDPRSPEVAQFASAHAEEVSFHQFLQWLAEQGLGNAQAAAREAGMPIGLIADLAVGADPGGSQAWGLQSVMLPGLTVGAPPDLLSKQGQNWGLGALSPRALKAEAYAPWIAMLRANMRHSGGIRIDHVLGLKRLWLVPPGEEASSGAYVHYPLDDLLRLTALESVRHRAIVIGEDLGTVPPGFSEQLAEAGVLGIRALWFQRQETAFLPPAAWPADAMATTSTHDLATVAGWWVGRDIAWREQLDLLGPGSPGDAQRMQREAEKAALWSALQQAGCSDAGPLPDAAPLDSVLALLGMTPATLAMVPLEDVFGIVEQPNLPGTVAVHPNWQQRLPDNAAALLATPPVVQRLRTLANARAASAARQVGRAEAAAP